MKYIIASLLYIKLILIINMKYIFLHLYNFVIYFCFKEKYICTYKLYKK